MTFPYFSKRGAADRAPPSDGEDDLTTPVNAPAPEASTDAGSFLQLMLSEGSTGPDDQAAVRTWSAAAIGQVVAMMGEDARTHLQAMEQVYVAANAKALVLLADEATAPTGIAMLQQIALAQTATTAFATGAAGVAAAFAKL